MFGYALRKSYDEFCSVVDCSKNDLNNDEIKKDVNYRLGTCLHWMMDLWERVASDEETQILQEHKALFSAFRYANNELKHGKTLVTLYQRTGGVSFPISFPLEIPPIAFRWAEIDLSLPKYESQFKHYQDLLEGKDIVETVQDALHLIDNYVIEFKYDRGDHHAHQL